MNVRRHLDGLDAEIRDHIEREAAEYVEQGMRLDDARRAAMRKFGNVLIAQENVRAVWVPPWAEHVLQDAQFALRLLLRNPVLSTVAVLTLALGIGMSTAVFSVFNSVLIRPLAYPDPDRLYALALHGEVPTDPVMSTDFVAWRERASSFERLVAYDNTSDNALATSEGATQIRIARVSQDFWSLSGARALFGHLPAPGESNVMVLSHLVGVAEDLKTSKLDTTPEPQLYTGYPNAPLFGITLVVRTVGDPMLIAQALNKRVADIDRTQAVFAIKTLENVLADSIAPRRFNLFLLATFAGTALLLTLIGVYGIMAYTVVQRTREFGIRMALGARRRTIVLMVFNAGIGVLCAGLFIGFLGVTALTRLTANLLYGVEPLDYPTYASVAILLAVTITIACLGPARRAASVDPVVALRSE